MNSIKKKFPIDGYPEGNYKFLTNYHSESLQTEVLAICASNKTISTEQKN